MSRPAVKPTVAAPDSPIAERVSRKRSPQVIVKRYRHQPRFCPWRRPPILSPAVPLAILLERSGGTDQ